MAEKRALCFEAGALEVWLCAENGRLRFFDPSGERVQSKRVPSFPAHVEV
jgi:hypothetical protein